MAIKRPLCQYDGRMEELRASDSLPAGPAYPRRPGTPKIVGDVAGSALTTLALTASRIYFVPIVLPRAVQLAQLRLSVTTPAVGSASIGIYANATTTGGDVPGALLGSVTGLDTGTTGDKSGSIDLVLLPGVLYWAALIGPAAATLRAVPTASASTALGRLVNGNNVISHVFAAGSGSTLPSTAPAVSDGTGVIPAIYLVEA